jgi:hypothetical protein
MVSGPLSQGGFVARFDFTGDWYGYRLRDHWLVAPDGQRISRTRLEGVLWRDAMELRLAGFSSRRRAEADRRSKQAVKVVTVQLADVRIDGRAAG